METGNEKKIQEHEQSQKIAKATNRCSMLREDHETGNGHQPTPKQLCIIHVVQRSRRLTKLQNICKCKIN